MTIKHPTYTQIPALRELWQQAFGDTDDYLNRFFTTAFSPDRCRCIEVAGKVAAALYWLDCSCQGERLAYLYAVATDTAYRGQGLCHRLMGDTHAHLRAAGYAGSVLVPGDESLFRFYGSMGYRTFGGIREFTAVANAPAAALRWVDPHEYAALRRQFLPQGGVVQEDATLAFLQTQAEFYAGENVLLAAVREDGHAFIPELLGNADLAGNILSAIGAKTGTIRTPGAAPFAIYLPLTSAEAPAYFGFALD